MYILDGHASAAQMCVLGGFASDQVRPSVVV